MNFDPLSSNHCFSNVADRFIVNEIEICVNYLYNYRIKCSPQCQIHYFVFFIEIKYPTNRFFTNFLHKFAVDESAIYIKCLCIFSGLSKKGQDLTDKLISIFLMQITYVESPYCSKICIGQYPWYCFNQWIGI